MADSTVVVGAHTDTATLYTVTITPHAGTTTDLTNVASVVLILPDASTKTVTQTSVTASQWVGTVRYQAWWSAAGVFTTKAKVTFADTTFETSDAKLTFSVET